MERMCGSLRGRKWYCGRDSTIVHPYSIITPAATIM